MHSDSVSEENIALKNAGSEVERLRLSGEPLLKKCSKNTALHEGVLIGDCSEGQPREGLHPETLLNGLSLEMRPEGLVLTDGMLELRADLTELLPRIKGGRVRSELLVKAAKPPADLAENPRTVIDATAGFGEDSLLLAAAGYHVILCERNPVIAELLKDALDRARQHPTLCRIAERMTLVGGDSAVLLKSFSESGTADQSDHSFSGNLSSDPDHNISSVSSGEIKAKEILQIQPDIVYLDPMFPERRKSALVKKKFQLLHQLEIPCTEEDARTLYDAAYAAHPRRIIVKRPPKGPYLADIKPTYSIEGKAVRYDVTVLPQQRV